MATVDHGVIVNSDSTWLWILPRCPKCGHVESEWSKKCIGVPEFRHAKHTISHGCSKCGHRFVITSYYG